MGEFYTTKDIELFRAKKASDKISKDDTYRVREDKKLYRPVSGTASFINSDYRILGCRVKSIYEGCIIKHAGDWIEILKSNDPSYGKEGTEHTYIIEAELYAISKKELITVRFDEFTIDQFDELFIKDAEFVQNEKRVLRRIKTELIILRLLYVLFSAVYWPIASALFLPLFSIGLPLGILGYYIATGEFGCDVVCEFIFDICLLYLPRKLNPDSIY